MTIICWIHSVFVEFLSAVVCFFFASSVICDARFCLQISRSNLLILLNWIMVFVLFFSERSRARVSKRNSPKRHTNLSSRVNWYCNMHSAHKSSATTFNICHIVMCVQCAYDTTQLTRNKHTRPQHTKVKETRIFVFFIGARVRNGFIWISFALWLTATFEHVYDIHTATDMCATFRCHWKMARDLINNNNDDENNKNTDHIVLNNREKTKQTLVWVTRIRLTEKPTGRKKEWIEGKNKEKILSGRTVDLYFQIVFHL